VDAADYLLKPVRFDRLRQAVERARRRRSLRASEDRATQLEAELEAARASGQAAAAGDEGFWIPERHGQRRVGLDDINWIEAARDYVLLHTDLRSHLLRITMAALEERLAGSQLVRVHRSAFVRPDRVEEVKRDGRSLSLVLAGGAEVQVGPSYVAATKAALGLE
jgi:two-component system LytT family response regulator